MTDFRVDEVAGIIYQFIDAANAADGHEPRPYWEDADEDTQREMIRAVTMLRDHPETTAAQNHAEWVAVMKNAGWETGEPESKVDYENRVHPRLVPFDELDPRTKRCTVAMHLLVKVLTDPIELVVDTGKP